MPRILVLLLLVTAVGGTIAIVAALREDSGRFRGGERDDGAEREHRPERVEPREETGAEKAPGTRYTFEGFVRDEQGDPVGGAAMTVYYHKADGPKFVTGPDGYFEADVEREYVDVRVVARGFEPAWESGNVDEPFAIVLKRAPWIEGRIVDEGGRPVQGATVYRIPAGLNFIESPDTARTNAEGAYVLPVLKPGVADVGVKVVGYLPALAQDVRVDGLGEHRQDFVLRLGRSVQFEVTGAEGIEVWVEVSDSRLRSMTLPPGGIATLRRAYPGRAMLPYPAFRVVGRSGTLSGLPDGAVDYEVSVRGKNTWVAEPGIGQLLDNTDDFVRLHAIPATIAYVTATDSETGKRVRPRITRITDGKEIPVELHAAGYFSLPDDERRHELRFDLEGYRSVRIEATNANHVQMQRVERMGAVKIVFEEKFDGRVAVIGRDGARAKQFDVEEGEVAKGIPPGTWDLTILATGRVPVRVPGVRVAAGATTEVRVRLHEGGGLELEVVDEDGKPLDKVSLDLRDANEERIDIHFLTMVSGSKGFTSVNYIPSPAKARADSGFAPGTYVLRAWREGYEVGSAEFTVAGTDVAKVSITLRAK